MTWLLEAAISKSLPAPIRDQVNHVMTGRAHRFWGGDNFEFGDANELHYVVIRGVSSPKPGQKFYVKSVVSLTNLVLGRDIQIVVVDRDDMMREVSDVFLYTPDSPAEKFNVGLELIRSGQAWYNGAKFEGCQSYAQAQRVAKENGFGLWQQESPVPPWTFSEQRHAQGSKLKL